jgi:hypothetical protein
MILGMRFLPKFGCCKGSAETAGAAGAPEAAVIADDSGEYVCADEPHLLRTVGWVSAALGAVALGLIVGRELRQRYKFNRRTPYDLYAHSGDELPDVDFGVGI